MFAKAARGNERAQLFLLDINTRAVRQLTHRPEAMHELVDLSPDGVYAIFNTTARNGKDLDVYVIDIATGKKECIFSGGGICRGMSISPDGRYLAVAKILGSGTHNAVYLCDLESRECTRISGDAEALRYGAAWLPDSTGFFFTTNEGSDFMYLARYDLARRACTGVYAPSWDVAGVALSADGARLLVLINEDGCAVPKMLRTDTFEEVACGIPKGDFSGESFSHRGTHIAYSASGARRTHDLYIHDIEANTSRRVVESFQGVPEKAFVKPELVRFSSFDGLAVPAFIYKPRQVPEGKRLPIIIYLHGGPASQYRLRFDPIAQYFAHAGYGYVAPNVRGSSGYGTQYMALDDREKRRDAIKDLVSLRAYLASLPWVDADRMVVAGGSYGGFMVYAALAFYPDLWAAGIVEAGIANFISFLEGTAPYRRAHREAEYGSLEKDREFLASISPINAVDKIQAPLCIIHGAHDPRVPLDEARHMADALQRQGKYAELIIYPDEGHGIAKQKNKIDLYPKIIAFLARALARPPRA